MQQVFARKNMIMLYLKNQNPNLKYQINSWWVVIKEIQKITIMF
ncbi:hypothetical protein [Spiroplasma poulsonii]|nr:hypothetical protein [Spiroplasma poulsonii]